MSQQHPTRLTFWSANQYQLLDFGEGRKLERFGEYLIDRACPAAAAFSKHGSANWDMAAAVVNEEGEIVRGDPDQLSARAQWSISYGRVKFKLKLTPFGHVGVFPEQAGNWMWFEELLRGRPRSSPPLRALNLFAYTGGSTLVLASLGVQVVHVDASAPAVNWARENAQQSALSDHPIRWIVDDARKFVAREQRRGNQYDLVVLDPPGFGHGPRGQRWEIQRDLAPLLRACCSLLDQRRPSHLLLTAHSPHPDQHTAVQLVTQLTSARACSDRLNLVDPAGRQLNAGYYVRASSC